MSSLRDSKSERCYCLECGEIFAGSGQVCPNCGARPQAAPQLDVRSLAAALTDLPLLHARAALSDQTYQAIQRTYESWLIERRPARTTAAAGVNPGAGAGEAAVPAGARPSGLALGQWAAARQADILLYLGAFLLSLAALVLAGYQGGAVSGPARFGILLVYTCAFLGLGAGLPRWHRVREAGAVFLGLGALLVPVDFIAFHVLLVGGSALSVSMLWLIGGSVTAALYLSLGLQGHGRFYIALGALAALVAWGALAAVFGLPAAWYGTWYVGLAAALNMAWAGRRLPAGAVVDGATAAIGVCGVLFAHVSAAVDPPFGAELPAAYALATAGAVAAASRRGSRRQAVLSLPPLLAMAGSSSLWAAGVPAWWWGYPWIVAVLLILVARPWWRTQQRPQQPVWALALLLTIAPPVLLSLASVYETAPLHGLVECLAAGGLALFIALRLPVSLLESRFDVPDAPPRTWERHGLMRLSGASLFAAAGYFNACIGAQADERAWAFAALGLAGWAVVGAAGEAVPALFELLAPFGVAGMALSGGLAWPNAGEAALLMTLGAAGPALAFVRTRRPLLWLPAGAFLAAAVACAWVWRSLDLTLLPIAYAGAAAAVCLALTAVRSYTRGERGAVIGILSWAPWLIVALTAARLLSTREDAVLGAHPPATTREWAVAAIVLGAGFAALTLESVRLRSRTPAVFGTLGLLLAGLMAIAIAQPGNVQAYTVPAGIYFIGLGLSLRTSSPFLGRQMAQHEAAIVVGVALLVVPPAVQSFSTEGQGYLIELIVAGLLFMAAGLTLAARWLVAGGVLTFTGVAIRALTVFGTHVPYWLTLGLTGMLCLGIGVLLLFQRDWWGHVHRQVAGWWLGEPDAGGLL